MGWRARIARSLGGCCPGTAAPARAERRHAGGGRAAELPSPPPAASAPARRGGRMPPRWSASVFDHARRARMRSDTRGGGTHSAHSRAPVASVMRELHMPYRSVTRQRGGASRPHALRRGRRARVRVNGHTAAELRLLFRARGGTAARATAGGRCCCWRCCRRCCRRPTKGRRQRGAHGGGGGGGGSGGGARAKGRAGGCGCVVACPGGVAKRRDREAA